MMTNQTAAAAGQRRIERWVTVVATALAAGRITGAAIAAVVLQALKTREWLR